MSFVDIDVLFLQSEMRTSQPDPLSKHKKAQETLPTTSTSYSKNDPLFEGLIDESDSDTLEEEEETQEAERDREEETSEEGASPSKKPKTDTSEAPEEVLDDKPERIWRLVTSLQVWDEFSLVECGSARFVAEKRHLVTWRSDRLASLAARAGSETKLQHRTTLRTYSRAVPA